MKTKILTFVAVMLLSGMSALAQSNETLKGDVNGDGRVDIADITNIVDIMLKGEVTFTYYFYLGTTKPTVENYKTLTGVVTSFTSIDDAEGTTTSIAAGETLYMLCPLKWIYGRTVSLEDGTGEKVYFSGPIDSETISGYTVYRTQVFNNKKNVVFKVDAGQNNEGETSVTGIATNITKNNATITAYANGILNNLATDIRVGIIYTSNGIPTRSNGIIVDVNKNTIATDGSYSITLTGITPETTYSYRSFVYQSGIWFYGDIRNFTTIGSGEVFTTGAASSVTCFSTSVAASVKVDCSSPYTTMTYGICYGTSIDPTIDNQCEIASNRDSSTGYFSVILRGLYGGTTYYYRPYAIIDGITKYGQSSQFKTLDDNVVETLSYNTETRAISARLILGSGPYSSLELGFCYAHTDMPTINDNTKKTNEVDDSRNFTTILPICYGINNIRAFVLIDGIPHYGNSIVALFPFVNVGQAVDLGLSVKWATMNLGASCPEEDGWYLSWGETEEKSRYDWANYKLCNGTSNSITKYNNSDNKTQLDCMDDAAQVNCGNSWRMPTYDELNELYTNCSWESMTINGKYGYLITGPNSNSIFMPATGYMQNNVILKPEGQGYYWSSTLSQTSSEMAKKLCVSSWASQSDESRAIGCSIRPVTEK